MVQEYLNRAVSCLYQAQQVDTKRLFVDLDLKLIVNMSTVGDSDNAASHQAIISSSSCMHRTAIPRQQNKGTRLGNMYNVYIFLRLDKPLIFAIFGMLRNGTSARCVSLIAKDPRSSS